MQTLIKLVIASDEQAEACDPRAAGGAGSCQTAEDWAKHQGLEQVKWYHGISPNDGSPNNVSPKSA
jgi:hypothetical protein